MGKHMDVTEFDYPYNLMDAIGLTDEDPLEALSDIGNAELAMCMCRLTEREKLVIRMRYIYGMSLIEVGNSFDLSRERVRQIEAKALRKLRGPAGSAPRYIMVHGAKAYVEMRIEQGIREQIGERMAELEKEYRQKFAELEKISDEHGLNAIPEEVISDARRKTLAMPVEDLGLSVRAYNCVRRAGCATVKDMITMFPTYEDAMKIRNLGRKSLDEVSARLREYRVVWPRQEGSC